MKKTLQEAAGFSKDEDEQDGSTKATATIKHDAKANTCITPSNPAPPDSIQRAVAKAEAPISKLSMNLTESTMVLH